MKFLQRLLFAFAGLLPCLAAAQTQSTLSSVTLSGTVRGSADKKGLPYVNVILSRPADSTFVAGTVTDEGGRFVLRDVRPADYRLSVSFMGYAPRSQAVRVGHLSPYLDLGAVDLDQDV
ncbi:MAG: carboxypeptidase regulatory-like domain-containing protein, partial [Cytophagales bacterium]|nr:carboxypeptidase regulatory-like domain-containing protein [Cytophagales bacterium]